MLTLYDKDGVDLTMVPPTPVSIAQTLTQGALYDVLLTGVEDDVGLGSRYVGGAVNWNDGGSLSEFSYQLSSSGTLPITSSRILAPGEHNVSVYVRNYRSPAYEEVNVNFKVTVYVSANTDSLKYLSGPILPKDAGYPNAKQWNFNLDTNLAVLASSVKMLLETQVGERIMLPEYGTDVRALLFEPEINGIEALIQERVTQALTRWEPRVSVVSVSVARNSNKSVTANYTLVSLLTRQQFQVATTTQT